MGLFGLEKENVRKGCKRKGSRELKKRREGFVGGHPRALSVFLFFFRWWNTLVFKGGMSIVNPSLIFFMNEKLFV